MSGPLTPMEQGGTWATLAQGESFLDACTTSGHVTVTPFGLASNGTPIRAVTVGSPGAGISDSCLLVVASQHGNEPAPREAALRLVRDLAFSAEPPDPAVTVVPTANPHGTAANDRVNAVGVDINRTYADLSTPEAAAITALIGQLPDGAVVIDAHEASNPDASGQPVVGQVNYRAVYHYASPAYRAWAGQVATWIQEAVGPATVAEYPLTPDAGLLATVRSSLGKPSLILETLITEQLADRVAWHLSAFKAARTHAAPSVPAASQAWAKREGFAAYVPVFLYDAGVHPAPIGYVMHLDDVPRAVFDTHGIRTVDRWFDGDEQYVPMDQPAYALIPWLIDPRAPRPIAPAIPVFSGDEAAVDLIGGRYRIPPAVSLDGTPVRRLVTADGIVWGT